MSVSADICSLSPKGRTEAMNDDNRTLFDRVAAKMGWKDHGGLDRAENKVSFILCPSMNKYFLQIYIL